MKIDPSLSLIFLPALGWILPDLAKFGVGWKSQYDQRLPS
jgi:hypothetical protein